MKAVISVFNKDNVVEFAKALNELGIEIIATAEIGIVAVNLLPLDLATKKPLDSMDIGGVPMLHSGIKNFDTNQKLIGY